MRLARLKLEHVKKIIKLEKRITKELDKKNKESHVQLLSMKKEKAAVFDVSKKLNFLLRFLKKEVKLRLD